MRNRGIEIFLLPEDPAASAGIVGGKRQLAAGNLHGQELEAALGYEGIPGQALPHAMAAAHAEVAAHAAQRHRWAGKVATVVAAARRRVSPLALLQAGISRQATCTGIAAADMPVFARRWHGTNDLAGAMS